MGILDKLLSNAKKIDVQTEINKAMAAEKLLNNSYMFVNVSGSSAGANVVINLGHMLSRKGYKVCIVDGSVAYPVIPTKLRFSGKGSLSNFNGVSITDEVIKENSYEIAGYQNLYVVAHSPYREEILDRLEMSVDSYINTIQCLKNFYDIVLLYSDGQPLVESTVAMLKESDKRIMMIDNSEYSAVNASSFYVYAQKLDCGVSECVQFDIDETFYDPKVLSEKLVVVAKIPFSKVAKDYANRKEPALSMDNAFIDEDYESAINNFVSYVTYKLGAS